MLRNAQVESRAAQAPELVLLCDKILGCSMERSQHTVFAQAGTAQFSPEAIFGKSFNKRPGDFLWADRRACLTGPILQLAAEPPSEKIDSWHGNELISPEMSSFY